MKNVSLPDRNRFIPDSFQNLNGSSVNNIFSTNLRTSKISKLKDVSKNEQKFNLTPSLLLNQNKFTVWHKTDETFGLPMYMTHLSIDSPYSHKSAKNCLFVYLMLEYINQEALKSLYDALFLGYKIDYENSGRGLEISIKGYSDKHHLVLLEILKIFNNINVNKEKFTFLQSIIAQNIKNDYSEMAYKRGKNILKKILRKYYYLPNELEKYVDDIDFNEFNDFVKDFKSKLRLELLVYGNVESQKSEALLNSISSSLQFEEATEDDLMKEKILNIKDQNFQFRDFNENKEDENNLMINYYQYGPYELNSSLQLSMIDMKMSNDAFNYLRGELQLGYVASSAKINLYGINGLVVFVQGSVANPVEMNEKTEEFLQKFSDDFLNMTDDEFNSMKESTMKILQEGEKEIEERSKFVWEEIKSKFYEFNKKKKAVEFLQNLKKNEFLRFYKTFLSQNIGKLSIQIFSQTKFTILDNVTNVDSKKEFIHVNGTSNIILSDLEGFSEMERYDYQTGNKRIESFGNMTEFDK